MNIADEAVALLRSCGYTTRSSIREGIAAEFEDEAIFGFIVVYDSVGELLDRWKGTHDAYLRSRATNVRAAAEKRSNLYAVFVTCDLVQLHQLSGIASIEENFVSSRKIVGTGITSRDLLRSALLPLLPLRIPVQIVDSDLQIRLRNRLETRPGLFEKLAAASKAEDLVKEVLAE